VLATDAATGRPLTNAEAFLSLGTVGERFLLGHAVADAGGQAMLAFPPAHTVEYTVLVRAPGRQAAIVTRSRNRHERLESDVAVSLSAGTPVGGVVNDTAGRPVGGAQVVVFRERAEHRRAWLRVEADVVNTDAAGRWTSAAIGDDLPDWRFEVRAPGLASVVYKVGDPATGTRVWGPSELRQAAARASLSSGPTFRILAVNGSGNPVPNAHVFWMTDEGGRPRHAGRTDSEGRWKAAPDEPSGSYRVVVLADGYAPGMAGFDPDSSAGELRLVLPRLGTLVGVVRDQTGEPVPGVEVRVQGWNDTDLLGFSGVTDAGGRFTMTNAAPGSLSIRLQRANFYQANYSMAWDQGELTLTMQRQTMAFGKVLDASTGKPIPEFTLVRGRAYDMSQPMSWERYNMVRGRNGAYSTRLDLYSSQGRCGLLVEAPGYLPAASPEWTRPGWYTNDFVLKPGEGLSGTVVLPDGTPAAGASLVLVDPNDSAYLDRPGQLSRSGASGDTVHADRQGRFRFAPRLNPWRLVAVHDGGFADVPVADVEKNSRVALVPWGRVEGEFKVGARLEPTQTVRLDQFSTPYYGSENARNSAVGMQFRTLPGPGGRFVFDKVPPGLRKVSVEYKFVERRNGGPLALSHGVPVDVKPGETTHVTLGGGGRRVTGHVRLLGGDPEQVNWLNDVHEMQLIQTAPPGQPVFMLDGKDDAASRERKQAEYHRAMAKYYASGPGQEFLRGARSYVCVFDTNGSFHIDNVPPGQYSLRIAPHEPPQQGDYYNYNELGSLNHSVTVPSGGAENEVLDIGTLDLRIRGQLRPGRPVPAFEVESLDGKTIRSADLRGRIVVLYFFASWASDVGDHKVLRALVEAVPPEGAPKVEVLFLSVDQQKRMLTDYLKEQKLPGTVCYVGEASQSPLVTALGIDGYPTAVVVDPRGRVGAFNLRGSSISRIVKQLSAAEARASAKQR
jgi:cytochrome oxidase Cu insertion factor (SCO1/SenC/PrrC family)